jgi:hypothetical protein
MEVAYETSLLGHIRSRSWRTVMRRILWTPKMKGWQWDCFPWSWM